ncbi:MAG: hypothetical protein ACYDB7_02270 [Mycobacteriales bacterium]
MPTILDTVIRPAAVLPENAARAILAGLTEHDVSRGGVWNVSTTVWQRYDQPWDGPAGMRGAAQLLGSIAVIYDSPQRHSITVYRASVTVLGQVLDYTVDRLCDEALAYAHLTLSTCPRIPLIPPPRRDPFYESRIG